MNDLSTPTYSQALQIALVDRLAERLPVPVYDAVPLDTPYPYVTFDRVLSNNADPLASQRDERFIYLSVWSEYQGQMEVVGIMDQIREAIHEQRLPTTVGRVISVRFLRGDTSRDVDGGTYTGSVTLRVYTER